ncbi:MAG: CPXCG motif-containing cysteine-rich protein [Bacteroidota bacterium]
MIEPVPLNCPYCGEDVELDVDESGGSRQSFVQDCPVCCRPWQVDVRLDPEDGWKATLRKEND